MQLFGNIFDQAYLCQPFWIFAAQGEGVSRTTIKGEDDGSSHVIAIMHSAPQFARLFAPFWFSQSRFASSKN